MKDLGSIHEVDEYGAAILSMFSKQRPTSQLNYESKVIVTETEFEE